MDERIRDADVQGSGDDIQTESETTPELTPEQIEKRKDDDRLLALAKKQLRQLLAGYQFFHDNALDDMKFRAGTWGSQSYQWPKGVKDKRDAYGRPCLTVNRIPSMISLVVNEIIAAHLVINVNPVDDAGDPELAEVLQSMIRTVENTSNAERAVATAADKLAEIGLAVLVLETEFADNKSWRQRAKIKRVKNPLMYLWDLAANEWDKKDANFAFELVSVDPESYPDLFGSGAPTPASLSGQFATSAYTNDWFPRGKVLTARWANRERHNRRYLGLLPTNNESIEAPTKKEVEALAAARGVKLLKCREVWDDVIVVRKIDAANILEESIWPADRAPFVPIIADELEIDGVVDFRGATRDMKDPGRIYNVEVSALVESVGLGMKSSVVGFRGQFGAPDSDMRKAWEKANREPVSFLEVDPLTIDGKIVGGIPQATNFEPPIDGIIQAIAQADNDIKSTGRAHDASLAEKGPQESGKAIRLRQEQDSKTSSHYGMSMKAGLVSVGQQLVQVLRKITDVATVIRVTGNDEKQRKVMVYSGQAQDPRNPEYLQKDPATNQPIPFQPPKGVSEKDIFDLSVGEFDITVTSGPATGTRRQEAVQAMTELMKALPPELSASFLDLYLLAQDWPMARQAAERVKKKLGIKDDDEQQDIPPEVVKAMKEAKAKEEALTAALMEAQEIIRTKRLELMSKENIEVMKAYLQILKIATDVTTDDKRALLEHEIARIQMMFQAGQERIAAVEQNQPPAAPAAAMPQPSPEVMAAQPPAPAAPPGGTGI